MVKSSLVDGGPYKCSHDSHDGKDFVTADQTEWYEHLDSHKSEIPKFGSKPCNVCGEIVVYNNMPHGMSPVHSECLKQLAAQGASD